MKTDQGRRQPGGERFVRVIAIGVLVLSAMVLLGWFLDIAFLKTVLPGEVSMKVNTAVGFMLSALALGLSTQISGSPRARRVATGCALLVIAIGATTLCEYLLGVNLGIDQLFIGDSPGSIATSHPGRMSPLSALDFVLLASAMLLVRRPKTVLLAQILVLFVIWNGLFNLIGYVYQVPIPDHLAIFTAVAVHTSAAFFALGLGVLGVRSDAGLMRPITTYPSGSVIIRRLLVAAVVAPTFFGWVQWQGQPTGIYDTRFGLGLMTIARISLLVAGIWWIALRLGRAELKLRASEARLSFALQTIHTGGWELDLVNHTTQRTVEHDRIFGYESLLPEWTYEKFLEHVLPEDRAEVDRRFQAAVATRTDWVFECRIRRVDGEVRWICATGRHVHDGTDQVRRLAGTVQDITEQKLTKEAVRQANEQSFHMLVSQVRDYAIYLLDPTGRVTSWNDGAARNKGYTAAEIVGRNFEVFFTSEDRAAGKPRQLLATALAQGHCEDEGWRVRKNGTRFLANIVVTPLRGDAGELRGFMKVVRDVTERKRAEAELTRVLRLQRAVLDGTVFSVIATDPDGIIEVFNRGAERMLGYTADEMVGRQTPAIIHVGAEVVARAAELSTELGRQIEPGFEAFVALARQGQVDEREWTFVRKDGSQLTVWLSFTALFDPAGELTGFLGIAQDLTERKEAEAARDEMAARLSKLSSQLPGLIYQFRLRPDGSSCFPYASEGIREIFRVTPEEVREDASKVFAVLHAEDLAAVTESIQESARSLELWQHEYRVRYADGVERWLLVNSMPEKEADGSVLWHGFITDITERKKTELQMRLSEERLRLAGEAAGVAVWEWDVTSGKILWDAGMFAIYGVAPSTTLEVTYQTWADAVHPEDLAAQAAQLNALVAAGGGGTREFRLVRGTDRSIRYIQAAERVMKNEKGTAVRVVGVNIDITDRKLAELAVHETRASLEKIFTSLSEGLVLQDAAGTILEGSLAAERILGLSRDQLMGRTSLDPRWHCIREDGSAFPGAEHPAMETLRTGVAQRDIVMGVHKVDGSLAWIEINTELIGIADDPKRQVVCSFRDVTARRAAAAALRASEQRLQNVLGQADCILWEADVKLTEDDWEWQIVYQPSGLFERLCGERLPKEGFAVWDRFEIPERAEMGQRCRDAFRNDQPGYTQEFKLIRGKQTLWLRETVSITKLRTGEYWLVGVMIDVTDRKEAEQATHRALNELEQHKFALDQHALVSVTDVQGRIIHANKRFCDTSRYRREELLGKTHRIVKSDEHSKEHFEEMYRVIGAGQVWQGEICNRAKDGSLYWVDTSIVPFMGPDRLPTHYIAIRTDITERKQLSVNLAQARDQALDASRLKSEFLATMSHEIRTPMNAVIGMAGLLYDTPLNATQADMTRIILGGAENLLTIINDILDFSRIEAGKMRIEPVDFNFTQIVEETVTLLAQRAQEKQLELTCDIRPWSGDLLLGDGGRVRQILTNLIGNAIKFTDRGEVEVTVQPVRETAKRTLLRVSVRDTGVGIRSEVQHQLFQPFVQADGSTTRRFGGTGLGLAISRQLIELMAGDIGFESEEGKGSVFWFELEFNRRGAAPPGPSFALPSGKRVLVVDDNEANRRIVLAQLERLGVAGEAVPDAMAALARLRDPASGPWDLVLLDWHMPGINGVDLALLLRSDPLFVDLPLVMLSSSGLRAGTQELEPEFAGHLTKPVSESQLKYCLIRVLAPSAGQSRPKTRFKKAKKLFGLRLLLVEDNAANQRVASILLEKMGGEVDWAENGQAGLTRLAAKKYDAVFMDCQMPVMDGYEATRRIRASEVPGLDPKVPVIAMTAYARAEDRARCLEAGMDDYVSKPIRETELVAALDRCGLGVGSSTAAFEPENPIDEEVFDREALETTRSLPGTSGTSLLPEMVGLYLSDEASRLTRLEELADDRAADLLAQEVHSFGGNAASFGGVQVRRIALDVEEAARARNWPAVADRLKGLRTACARLRKEIDYLKLLAP